MGARASLLKWLYIRSALHCLDVRIYTFPLRGHFFMSVRASVYHALGSEPVLGGIFVVTDVAGLFFKELFDAPGRCLICETGYG